MKLHLSTVILLILFITSIECDLQLKFVTVLFRHGDRAPESDSEETYPNDPYKNNDYFPGGPGGLINQGKLREYMLGVHLRTRYNDFLNDTYIPKELFAQSTDYDRTQMSLQLVLSGLYPPNNQQKWNTQLNWQPIPYRYQRKNNDSLLQGNKCVQYKEENKRVSQLPEVREKLIKFQPLMDNLTNSLGMKVKTLYRIARIYHTLVAQTAVGLKLPEWTENVFPNGELYEAILLDYQVNCHTDKLKRLHAGTFIRNIIETFTRIANEVDNERKMNLFSSHETTIAAALCALGVYNPPHVPQYSSAIFLELHRDKEQYYVKILYYLGIPVEVVELTIPDCDNPCSMDNFVTLLKNVTASDAESLCQSS